MTNKQDNSINRDDPLYQAIAAFFIRTAASRAAMEQCKIWGETLGVPWEPLAQEYSLETPCKQEAESNV